MLWFGYDSTKVGEKLELCFSWMPKIAYSDNIFTLEFAHETFSSTFTAFYKSRPLLRCFFCPPLVFQSQNSPATFLEKEGGGCELWSSSSNFLNVYFLIIEYLINLISLKWQPHLHSISSTLLPKANICSSLPWLGIATKYGKRWDLLVFYLLWLITFKLHKEL